jgi:hypothetical protein
LECFGLDHGYQAKVMSDTVSLIETAKARTEREYGLINANAEEMQEVEGLSNQPYPSAQLFLTGPLI